MIWLAIGPLWLILIAVSWVFLNVLILGYAVYYGVFKWILFGVVSANLCLWGLYKLVAACI
ncbi:MAG: hypothetical protein SOY64_04475 [Pyramidobacter sp.]|uniref:hypothetical protein n=1 Tax=Pyramidobacter sp. TaxID=1943581 RepID=UPI002A83181D|nr:hypothetical protein [Pyramidobacter sp.]MDY4032313.1 hypothetical protein [Pyramidobacter sp.]